MEDDLQKALVMIGLVEKDSDLTDSQYSQMVLVQDASDYRSIRFKVVYVDMAGGDVLAGLLLSQIMFWHMPDSNGRSKLRVFKDGHYWIAKEQGDWWNEVRLNRRQAQRCVETLISLNLIECQNFRFNGMRTNHIRIKWKEFENAHRAALRNKDNPPVAPNGATESTETGDRKHLDVQPLTEITTEITSDISAGKKMPAAISQSIELDFPPGTSEKTAKDAHFRCPLCGVKDAITWWDAVTPCCQTPIHWTGNKWLDKQLKNAKPVTQPGIPKHRDPAIDFVQQLCGAKAKPEEVSVYTQYVHLGGLDAFKAMCSAIYEIDKAKNMFGRGILKHIANAAPSYGKATVSSQPPKPTLELADDAFVPDQD
jgi:hypothetical protein